MGYKNLEQQQQAVEAAKYENAKRQTRVHVYQKYLRVLPCDANDKLVSDICDRWLGGNPDVLHSLTIFEQAIAQNPTEYNMLAKQKEEKTCEQLIDQIIAMLAAHGKGHDAFTLKQERTRLGTFTIPALRARLADLQTKAHMATQSVASLKAMVAEAHADRREFPGFPTLPKTVWNGTTHVPVNAAFFKALDGYEIRRYTRLYSVEQVNQRIQEG